MGEKITGRYLTDRLYKLQMILKDNSDMMYEAGERIYLLRAEIATKDAEIARVSGELDAANTIAEARRIELMDAEATEAAKDGLQIRCLELVTELAEAEDQIETMRGNSCYEIRSRIGSALGVMAGGSIRTGDLVNMIAEAKKDTARLDWLESRGYTAVWQQESQEGDVWGLDNDSGGIHIGAPTLRAAIDDASSVPKTAPIAHDAINEELDT